MSRKYLLLTLVVVAMITLLTLPSVAKRDSVEYITATALGQGFQMGARFDIQIAIYDYSSTEDQQTLLGAFKAGGMKALTNALKRMPSMGRISMPATTGYEVNYVRVFQMPDGSRRIRMVTNRQIRPGEVVTDAVSEDYSLSGFDITCEPGGKKCEGTLYPSAALSTNAEGQIVIETYADKPWRLTNVEDKVKN